MKKFMFCIGLAWLVFIPSLSTAQSEKEFEDSFNAAFKQFKQKNIDEFNAFRDKINQEFSAFLKRDWEAFVAEQPQERPMRPEPETPPVAKPDAENPKPQELDIDTTVPIVEKPADVPQETPGIEPVIPPEETDNKVPITFYGRRFAITPLLRNPFVLNDLTENEIAAAWSTLSALPYGQLLNECAGIRDALQLNDWGYFLLCGEVSRRLLNRDGGNETAFLQTFLLCQSGYDAKIARADNELLLLAPSSVMIYGHSFLPIEGKKYFVLNKKTTASGAVYTYRQNFSLASKPLDMYIRAVPQLSEEMVVNEKRLGDRDKSVSVPVNKALIDFYRDYPQCDFPVYMYAPVDTRTSGVLLSALQQYISGKTELDAVNRLLGFVQRSFEYKTDPEQFGYEKPFFIEENFFYPYCDCEDRAVLFAYLVRELLNLDVVLLDYPNHIATAVCFSDESVSGDYVRVDNRKYVVCDPTYINALAGEAMPQCKTASAQIIKY